MWSERKFAEKEERGKWILNSFPFPFAALKIQAIQNVCERERKSAS
jgi:hypothetical protein